MDDHTQHHSAAPYPRLALLHLLSFLVAHSSTLWSELTQPSEDQLVHSVHTSPSDYFGFVTTMTLLPTIVLMMTTIFVALSGAEEVTLKDDRLTVADIKSALDHRRSFHESLQKAREESRAKWELSRTGQNLRHLKLNPQLCGPHL
jgi:hypothetical protein